MSGFSGFGGGLGGLPFPLPGPNPWELGESPPWAYQQEAPGGAGPSGAEFLGPMPVGVAPSIALPSINTDMGVGPLGTSEIGGIQRTEEDQALEVSSEVTSDSPLVVATPGLRLCGFTAKETTGGAPARAVLRRGAAAGAPVLCFVGLDAGAYAGEVFGSPLRANEGIYFDLVSGAMTLVCYYKVVPERL
jgi:hypothetical protein